MSYSDSLSARPYSRAFIAGDALAARAEGDVGIRSAESAEIKLVRAGLGSGEEQRTTPMACADRTAGGGLARARHEEKGGRYPKSLSMISAGGRCKAGMKVE